MSISARKKTPKNYTATQVYFQIYTVYLYFLTLPSHFLPVSQVSNTKLHRIRVYFYKIYLCGCVIITKVYSNSVLLLIIYLLTCVKF